MLYTYAITPDVFEASPISEENREGLIAVELLRGIQQNGVLADLHNGQWLSYVRRRQDFRHVAGRIAGPHQLVPRGASESAPHHPSSGLRAPACHG